MLSPWAICVRFDSTFSPTIIELEIPYAKHKLLNFSHTFILFQTFLYPIYSYQSIIEPCDTRKFTKVPPTRRLLLLRVPVWALAQTTAQPFDLMSIVVRWDETGPWSKLRHNSPRLFFLKSATLAPSNTIKTISMYVGECLKCINAIYFLKNVSKSKNSLCLQSQLYFFFFPASYIIIFYHIRLRIDDSSAKILSFDSLGVGIFFSSSVCRYYPPAATAATSGPPSRITACHMSSQSSHPFLMFSLAHEKLCFWRQKKRKRTRRVLRMPNYIFIELWLKFVLACQHISYIPFASFGA